MSNNENLEFTDKDMHCISRHIQVDVIMISWYGAKEVPNACELCNYSKECLDDNNMFDWHKAFYKLSKKTGIKYPLNYNSKLE